MAQISSSSSTPDASSQSSTVHNDGSTIIERTIKKTIDGIHFFLNPSNMTSEEQEKKAVIKISEATQKFSELQIKTLQDAPRDPDKLRELLKVKERQYEKATLAEEIQSLVTEIEILKFVQFLVNRNFTSS